MEPKSYEFVIEKIYRGVMTIEISQEEIDKYKKDPDFKNCREKDIIAEIGMQKGVIDADMDFEEVNIRNILALDTDEIIYGY